MLHSAASRLPGRFVSFGKCAPVSCLPVFIQNRGKAKKWDGDFVQLFVNEYQHSNPLDHSVYQYRRFKYARKGLVAPRANDYDSPEEDLEEDIRKYLPKRAAEKNKARYENFMADLLEAYKDYRREQKIAKDDPRSPFYFEDDEEAKAAAVSSAATAATTRAESRMLDESGASLSHPAKHKLMSDPAPPKYSCGTKVLSSYIPEPEPVTYPHWDPYLLEFPLSPEKATGSKKEGIPIGLPQWREADRKEDGSAVGKGSRKDASAVATIRRGTGVILINDKPMIEYFPRIDARDRILAPFLVAECLMDFDASIKVRGGGVMGQAGAASNALAKALEKFDPSFRLVLKNAGLITRDARVVERKKPGKPGARKSFQWVKR